MRNLFEYKDGELFAENCSVSDIAEQYGTPFYLYSTKAVQKNYRSFESALESIPYECGIFYAIKANSNQAIITLLAKCGAGADVVSKGEIMRAIKAGISPSKIVFSGVGKTQAEIAFALEQGILQFNVESRSELLLLNKISQEKGVTPDIALRINPDVDAETLIKISTGKSENKFGIPKKKALKLYQEAQAMSNVNPVSIAVHIGSQLTNIEDYKKAWEEVLKFINKILDIGIKLKRLDLGGGIGVNYNDEPTISLGEYTNLVNQIFSNLQEKIPDLFLMFEPGRILVSNSGALITQIIYIKGNDTNDKNKNFVIIDAAMNDFIRPTLYNAYHKVEPVIKNGHQPSINKQYDIVGPICESGDYLAQDEVLPANLKNGDLLWVHNVGAYGAVMSNTYNTRPLIAEILVNDKKVAVIRQPVDEYDIINMDSIPKWLS